MFTSLEALENGQTLKCDVCIMGAGAAGITLALELENSGLDVCMFEGGGFEAPAFADTHPYVGETVGRPYDLLATRLRYFGGSTNHWGGWCMPLDPIDFRVRSYVPLSGWPFERSELQPYYIRAARICEIDPPGFDLEKLPGGNSSRKELLGNYDSDFTVKLLRYSPPTRFGSRYRPNIEKSQRIRCFLNSTVVEIEGTPRSVSKLRVRAGTKEFFVESRVYIAALGAIENARLLLCSDGANPNGLGNESDFVGRCFADHIGDTTIGHALLSTGVPYLRLHDLGQFRVMPHLALRDEFLEANELVNFGAVAVKNWSPEDIFTADYFADTRLYPEWQKRKAQKFGLRIRIETTPNRDSRISLLASRDSNGMRRSRLDWRVNSVEFDSIRRITGLFGKKLGESGAGRFRPIYGKSGSVFHSHHMGTTRMSADPNVGVTNSDCRVHAVDNLYIAGSSVFPTFGFTNPTLTIVALGIRLADYLKRKVMR